MKKKKQSGDNCGNDDQVQSRNQLPGRRQSKKGNL